MAVATALDERAGGDDRTTEVPASGAPPQRALFRLVLLGVLVVVLCRLGRPASRLLHRQTRRGREVGPTSGLQADREAAMAHDPAVRAAGQHLRPVAARLAGPDAEVPLAGQGGDHAEVRGVVRQSVPVAEQSVKNYGLDRTCAVFSTGVEVIDSDSAQVLVAGSISQTVKNRKGKRVSTGEPSPFRLRVSLDKIDGTMARRRLRAGDGTVRVTMNANWYDVLDVDPTATADEIRAAWRGAVADLDPTDRRFRVYNQAAEVLLDPARRSAYDGELAAEQAPSRRMTRTS